MILKSRKSLWNQVSAMFTLGLTRKQTERDGNTEVRAHHEHRGHCWGSSNIDGAFVAPNHFSSDITTPVRSAPITVPPSFSRCAHALICRDVIVLVFFFLNVYYTVEFTLRPHVNCGLNLTIQQTLAINFNSLC